MYVAADAIEFLMTATGGGAQDQEHRVLRQALFHAYRDLLTAREWKWYHATDTVAISSNDLTTDYDLPWGVTSVDSIFLPTFMIAAEYVDQTEMERSVAAEPSTRILWTIYPPASTGGYYRLRIFNGAGYTEDTVLTYRRRPRDLRFTGWEPDSKVGTVNFPSGAAEASVTVSGTSTLFSSFMVGAAIRASGSTTRHPESLAGITPYQAEAVITAVGSATSLTATNTIASASLSGSKYIVTDILDISPSMYTALLSGSEMWVARLLGKDPRQAAAINMQDLKLAFEQDSMAPVSGMRLSGSSNRASWYSPQGPDEGV